MITDRCRREKKAERVKLQTDVVEEERQREFDYTPVLWRKKGRESLTTDGCYEERKAERV